MLMQGIIAVSDKLLHDIERKLFRTTIIVQLIFFGYYGYSIYSNLTNVNYLIIYLLLLVLSSFSFIHYLVNYRREAKGNVQTVRFVFRISKYLVNGSMLVFNIIEISRNGGSDIAYALIGLSSLSLVIQILLEFVRSFANEYVKLYKAAFEHDFGWIKSIKDFDLTDKIYGAVGSSLNKIANGEEDLSGDDDKYESKVNELIQTRKVNVMASKQDKKQSRIEKRKEKYKEHREKIKNDFGKAKDKAINNIKNRFKKSEKK